MTSPLPAAVLWDMDGTMIDTERIWARAERELVEKHGGRWTDVDSWVMIGRDMLACGAYIRDAAALPMTPEQVVDHLIDEMLLAIRHGVTWQPGVRELLAELSRARVPCALVTMSYRVQVDEVVAQLPADVFAVTVSGDEVAHGKPHPEPYLTAAARLGVDPVDCVVIEDSPAGTTAGLAAGARVVAVPGEVPVKTQPGLVPVDSLVGLAAGDLLGLFDETRPALEP